ncbi:MAG: hypothetical protein QW683_08805 [Candidatus Caldarchaeum sp.]
MNGGAKETYGHDVGGVVYCQHASRHVTNFLACRRLDRRAFLVVSIGQWLAEMRQRWLEQGAYRHPLRQSVIELIQLDVNGQSIAHCLHPVLTSAQASQTADQLRQKLDKLIQTFVPCALVERLWLRLLRSQLDSTLS